MPKQTNKIEPSQKNIVILQVPGKPSERTPEAQRRRLERISNAYEGSYSQGTILLQAIRLNAKRPMNERMIVEAAKNILRTWEPDAVDPMRIFTFIKFVQYFVNKTTLPLSDMSLDHGIIMSCVSNSALPVVCPPITLVIATGYIDKLRKRCPKTMAQRGSTQRLFLTAYNIAAKYIHSNLGAVIAASSLLRNRIKGAATDLPRPETRRLQQASVVKTPPTTTTPRHVPQPLKFSSTEAPISPPPTPTHIPPRPTPYPQSQHRRTPEPYLHPPSQILTHTTAQLAMLLPRTTVQELTKMELEFLHFLDYDLTVHSSAELMGWWERCVGIDRLQIVPDCRAEDSIRDEISDTGSRTDDDEVVPNL